MNDWRRKYYYLIHKPSLSRSGIPVTWFTLINPKGIKLANKGGTEPTAPISLLMLAKLQLPETRNFELKRFWMRNGGKMN